MNIFLKDFGFQNKNIKQDLIISLNWCENATIPFHSQLCLSDKDEKSQQNIYHVQTQFTYNFLFLIYLIIQTKMFLVIIPTVQEIALYCSCPPACKCGNKKPREWYHVGCGKKVFLNVDGDLNCQSQGCNTFFIQHAKFICDQARASYQYRSTAEFMMSLAQGLQSAEYGLSDNDLQLFTGRLMESVRNKWVK
ncbi:hypothetical protein pb186bvf_016039 [Paramecium bursaria]